MIWPLTLGDVLRIGACRFPERAALICGERTLSYGELEELATRFARGLTKRGLTRGDRVVLMLPNGIEFLIALYGIVKAGGAFVPVSDKLKPFEVKNILSHSEAVGFVASRIEPKLQDALGDVPIVVSTEVDVEDPVIRFEHLQAPGDSPLPRVIDQDWAAVIYTSGTTGEPKGAILTHLNMMTSCRGMIDVFGINVDDHGLVILPLAHIFAIWMQLTHLMVGASLVIHERFSRKLTIRDLALYEITTVSVVPSILSALLSEAEFSKRTVASLRSVITGGAGIPASVWDQALSLLPSNAKIYDAYGQTETVGTTIVFDSGNRREGQGAIGWPVPYVRVRLVDNEGNDVAPGEVGEIVIQGSKVMLGYLRNPQATEMSLRNGYYHSGDLARMDSRGCIFLVGRKKDLLIRGGLNVFPQEIEFVLSSHPEVADVAVIGVADSFYGEVVKAVIVRQPHSDVNATTLQEWCRQRLADYKVPTIVEFRDELPRNEAGKVVKRLLA